MPVTSLRDLFIDELQDLFDAEQQILQALPDFAAGTQHDELKHALIEHLDQTRMHVERLRLICRGLNVAPEGEPCTAMRGLLLEARTRVADAVAGDVRDATIIGAAQRVEHYEIAAYGCARSYASQLGLWDAEKLLQQSLDEEGATDKRLSRIAERRVNVKAAGEDARADVQGPSARLRYVALDAMPSVNYAGFHAINRFNERLGDLDGFVVDAASGRPYYLVIDSGGLLSTRRYLIPVGRSHADLQARAIRIDIDTDSLKRYPEFTGGAFEAMSDEAIDRYERQVLDAIAPREAGWTGRPDYEVADYQADWIMRSEWMTSDRDAQAAPTGTAPDPMRSPAPDYDAAPSPGAVPREYAVAQDRRASEPDHAPDPGQQMKQRVGERGTSEEPPRRIPKEPPPTIDRAR